MTGLISAVLSRVPKSCTVTTLNKGRCIVRLGRTPAGGKRLIIDFDQPSSHWDANRGRRCDYLFLEETPNEPGRVRPIELKGNSFRATTVIAQLQVGANMAERLIPPRFDIDYSLCWHPTACPKQSVEQS